MSIEVKDFILCDDIRNEEGRKFSVMGIYANKLRVMPKTQQNMQKYRIPISAFIRLRTLAPSKGKQYTFSIDITFEKSNVAKIEGGIVYGEDTISTLSIPRMEFDIEKPGTLNFNLVVKDNNKDVLEYDEKLNIIIETMSAQQGEV